MTKNYKNPICLVTKAVFESRNGKYMFLHFIYSFSMTVQDIYNSKLAFL